MIKPIHALDLHTQPHSEPYPMALLSHTGVADPGQLRVSAEVFTVIPSRPPGFSSQVASANNETPSLSLYNLSHPDVILLLLLPWLSSVRRGEVDLS